MKRDEIMDMMKTLKLRGMMASYDEVLLEGRRNRHSPARHDEDFETARHDGQL